MKIGLRDIQVGYDLCSSEQCSSCKIEVSAVYLKCNCYKSLRTTLSDKNIVYICIRIKYFLKTYVLKYISLISVFVNKEVRNLFAMPTATSNGILE